MLTSSVLIRVHNRPRSKLFTPNEDPTDPCPLPLEYLDILRRTDTNCSALIECAIDDYWVEENVSKRELSEEWIGRTMFHLLRPQPPKGYYYCNTRLTKRQQTTRPDNLWVEEWDGMSKPARAKAIADWGAEKLRRDDVRGRHGLLEEIPEEKKKAYNCDMAKYLEKYLDVTPPAMPCVLVPDKISSANTFTPNITDEVTIGEALVAIEASAANATPKQRVHQEKWAPSGFNQKIT